jgi:hypothetical protein
MTDALAIIADDKPGLGDLDEFARQIALRVNERSNHIRRPGRKHGWGISPNIERASPAREKKPPAPTPTEAPTIAPPEVDAVLIHGNTRNFEPFRIVEDYDALCEALSERVEDLQATRLGVDAAGGFAGGHASTLLCRPQIKGYGPVSLTRMLKATGMVIVLAIDEERFAKVREVLGRRERPLRSPARKLPAPPLTVVHGEQKRGNKYG